MTMQSPGQAPRQTIVLPAHTKRVGLMMMQIDSMQLVPIRQASGKMRESYVKVRDARAFPNAKGVYVCLADQCHGRTWATEAAMLADHPDTETMVKKQQVHVYGIWSETPDPAWDNCPDCTTIKDGKDTRREPCTKHVGAAPILGLLSFG